MQFYEQVYEQYFCFLNEMSISPSLWAWLTWKIAKFWSAIRWTLHEEQEVGTLSSDCTLTLSSTLTLSVCKITDTPNILLNTPLQPLPLFYMAMSNPAEEKRLKKGKIVCHTNSFNFLIIWDWRQAVWRESATKPLPIIKLCLCARGNACQNRKKNVITESVPCWISLAVAIQPLFHVLKTLLSLLQPHACTKDSNTLFA